MNSERRSLCLYLWGREFTLEVFSRSLVFKTERLMLSNFDFRHSDHRHHSRRLFELLSTMADANSTQHPCANCQQPAINTCSACKDAPQYDPAVIEEKPWYCTTECQRIHWTEHRRICKALKQRKEFFRLGSLLQGLFYMYREKVFDRPVVRMEEDGKLLVHESAWPRIRSGLDMVQPFPSNLCRDTFDKQSLLVYLACEDAVGWMHDLVRVLAPGE